MKLFRILLILTASISLQGIMHAAEVLPEAIVPRMFPKAVAQCSLSESTIDTQTGRHKVIVLHTPHGVIRVVEGADITKQPDAEAIVNAANDSLIGSAGIAQAIQDAAGPELIKALEAFPVKGGIRCPTGQAVTTKAFNLPNQYVIHAVGPKGSDHDCDQLLADTYRSIFREVIKNNAKRVDIPAISTGIFGFPPKKAAEIAVQTAFNTMMQNKGIREIRFIVWGEDNLAHYKQNLSLVASSKQEVCCECNETLVSRLGSREAPCKKIICAACVDKYSKQRYVATDICTQCRGIHDMAKILGVAPQPQQKPALSSMPSVQDIDPFVKLDQARTQRKLNSSYAMAALATYKMLEVLQAKGKINVAQHLPMAQWLALFGAMSFEREQYQKLLSDKKAFAGLIGTLSKLALAYQAVDFAKKLYLTKDPQTLFTKETAQELGKLVAKMGGISAIYMLADKLSQKQSEPTDR